MQGLNHEIKENYLVFTCCHVDKGSPHLGLNITEKGTDSTRPIQQDFRLYKKYSKSYFFFFNDNCMEI